MVAALARRRGAAGQRASDAAGGAVQPPGARVRQGPWIPVIDCGRGERKHRIAEEYLATHTVGVGVFLILVARAAATVWEVKRSTSGVIGNLAKKTAYVNYYLFHIMDPDWVT